MKIRAEIRIEGIKPLLINTFPIESLSSTKRKSGTTGNSADEWKNTVLADENRNLYVFPSYLVSSITAGGKQIKIGKATLNKRVGATLEIQDEKLLIHGRLLPEEGQLLDKSSEPVYLDIRSVVNPMTKGRNLRYRVACSPQWKIQTTINWDDTAVSKEDMKQCVENAGLFEGIGDGRKIGFGRFTLVHFQVLKS